MTDEKIGKEMYNIACKLIKDRYNNNEGGLALLGLKMEPIILASGTKH